MALGDNRLVEKDAEWWHLAKFSIFFGKSIEFERKKAKKYWKKFVENNLSQNCPREIHKCLHRARLRRQLLGHKTKFSRILKLWYDLQMWMPLQIFARFRIWYNFQWIYFFIRESNNIGKWKRTLGVWASQKSLKQLITDMKVREQVKKEWAIHIYEHILMLDHELPQIFNVIGKPNWEDNCRDCRKNHSWSGFRSEREP